MVFTGNLEFLGFPVAAPDRPVFRDAQRGALFAIGARFSGRGEPAIVTMPTGSGETAVLQAAALLLRAGRVLVVTPTRLVRAQIPIVIAIAGQGSREDSGHKTWAALYSSHNVRETLLQAFGWLGSPFMSDAVHRSRAAPTRHAAAIRPAKPLSIHDA